MHDDKDNVMLIETQIDDDHGLEATFHGESSVKNFRSFRGLTNAFADGCVTGGCGRAFDQFSLSEGVAISEDCVWSPASPFSRIGVLLTPFWKGILYHDKVISLRGYSSEK